MAVTGLPSKEELLHLATGDFEETAWRLFRYQALHNPVYRQYLTHLRRESTQVNRLADIPFLPISFFRTHAVLTGRPQIKQIFGSSGTTGSSQSRHHVAEPDFYETLSLRIFEQTYGPLKNWYVLALLPSYLERNDSSLVYMVRAFIRETGSPESSFYLHEPERLLAQITRLRACQDRNILLLGVTFALLDLAETHPTDLTGVTIMETGGMKGRRTEPIREEVHAALKKAFNVSVIHSEYGMTELLSQAYSPGEGIFYPPPTLRLLLREPNDPFAQPAEGRPGVLNVIDLANVDSCAFIETQDLGRLHPDGSFEVLGRMDNAQARGCSLLTA